MVLRRGEPEDAIPEFVVSEGIDVLVIGTVARGGIPGMLIGNTHEAAKAAISRIEYCVPPSVLTTPLSEQLYGHC